MIDYTWNIGVIVQIAVLVLGGIVMMVTLLNTVKAIKVEMAATKKENDRRFDSIQGELKNLTDILINMARFDEKLSNLDKRVTSQGSKIDDLSRGQGFVRGVRTSVDGEYGP